MKLKEFFIDEKITIPFKLFGKTHIFLLLFVIIGCLIIYINKEKIFNIKPKNKKKFTKIMASILLLNMLTLYVSSIYYQAFDYKDMLPFHLCYIANYFYIIVVFLNKENLYKYSYFLSFLGPIPAIIFFDVPSVWESFNFYLYVISHHILVLTTFLTFYMYPKTIKIKDTIKLAIVLNILYIAMSIFNAYFNTNYCFSGGIPEFIINLFTFLKYIPTTIILEITEIGILCILYIFFNREYKKIILKQKCS